MSLKPVVPERDAREELANSGISTPMRAPGSHTAIPMSLPGSHTAMPLPCFTAPSAVIDLSAPVPEVQPEPTSLQMRSSKPNQQPMAAVQEQATGAMSPLKQGPGVKRPSQCSPPASASTRQWQSPRPQPAKASAGMPSQASSPTLGTLGHGPS